MNELERAKQLLNGTKWLDCGNGMLKHPNGHSVMTRVVELKDFGRIFEVYNYGNDPEGDFRLILAAPAMLKILKDIVCCAKAKVGPCTAYIISDERMEAARKVIESVRGGKS